MGDRLSVLGSLPSSPVSCTDFVRGLINTEIFVSSLTDLGRYVLLELRRFWMRSAITITVKMTAAIIPTRRPMTKRFLLLLRPLLTLGGIIGSKEDGLTPGSVGRKTTGVS